MVQEIRENRRSRLGYGSSYRKGSGQDGVSDQEIRTVLGGQVWMVKPEKAAMAKNPCIWMQAGDPF